MNETIDIQRTGDEIAIIGMAVRFPGAKNIEEFWNNLKNGIESIIFFSDEELIESEVAPEWMKNPAYVKTKGGLLDNKEFFDAVFFEYTPKEAEILDPQSRIFHECAWEALENAGYVPYTYNGLIGLYAGASSSSYWEALVHFSGMSNELGEFSVGQLASRDFLCTRVAHRLDLRGPAINIQTACSTSLVAVHMACQAILDGECSMALAGGISVRVKESEGYLFQEGMIYSPDGHCRAFAAQAKGCVGGNGAGVVALKTLASALADGDYIYAVIRGSAINNDGLNKAGYAAPSVKGQANVIQAALQLAAVNPESISYVETHGTGTELGDPIEIEALKQAFNTKKKGFCAIGSVKTNIGHLDAAAGVAGLIKVVLALKNRLIPPSLHYQKANPKIDFENSPFYVNPVLKEWNNENRPRLAGVSSFGIGGTNAHVILEEAPVGQWVSGSVGQSVSDSASEDREYQLILLSAKTPSAWDKMTHNLVEYFKNSLLNRGNHDNPVNPGLTLADVAYTLQVGRKAFPYRKMLVCSSLKEAIAALSTPGPGKIHTFLAKEDKKKIIFMFPGQGSQYINMGLELYEREPVFRQEMDRCFAILEPIMGYDIREILYPGDLVSEVSEVSKECRSPDNRSHQSHTSYNSYKSYINRTEIAQPLLFIFEYALSKLLMKWGIKPYAMIGHSIGEYTAACLAGVFSLEDALMLVNERGRLMQQMPVGAMLGVPLSHNQLEPLLNAELSLAAVNSPTHCVVSGSHECIDAFEKQLKEKGFDCRLLHTSHAFHSKAMDPILKKFEEKVREIKLNIPQISYISNVTGNWISVRDVKNPVYWSTQLRQAVRFSDGVDKLLENKDIIFVEVGPGKTLSTFVRQHKIDFTSQKIINLMPHPNEDGPDDRYLLSKFGELWLFGVNVDWKNFYENQKRHRIPLPSYPFERKRFPIGNDFFKIQDNIFSKENVLRKNPDKERWFYIPVWEQSAQPVYTTDEKKERLNWLVFMDEKGVGSRIAEGLGKDSQYVVTVKSGQKFSAADDYQFVINPRDNNDYDLLFEELKKIEMVPHRIIHLWNLLIPNDMNSVFGDLDKHQDSGFYSLLYMVQAIGKSGIANKIKLQVITCGMQNVTGEEELNPLQALVRGAIKVIPLEYSNIHCCNVDILLPGPGSPREDKLVSRLLGEFEADFPDIITAYRGTHRWVQKMVPHRLDKSSTFTRYLKEKGVYLVTGGFGGMGFSIAQHLAKSFKARLILVGRSKFPGRENWQNWLAAHDQNEKVSIKIRKILEVEETGARIMAFSADISDEKRMKEVIANVEESFGQIDGIIHTAGTADMEGVIQRRTRPQNEKVMASKVKGILILDHIFKNKKLKFFALFSTLGNMLYKIKFGQVGYIAANEFLDAFAHFKSRREGTHTFSINWADWKEVGMSVEAIKRRAKKEKRNIDYELELVDALLPNEGVDVFKMALGSGLTQVVISTSDLVSKLEFMNTTNMEKSLEARVPGTETWLHNARPALLTKYINPVTETEKILAHTWGKFLGIQQVGTLDDFFELGGDSLKAMALLAKIQKELKVKIPIAVFFERPCIKFLAEYINIKNKEEFHSLEPIEKKEYYDLSSAQLRLFVLQQMNRNNVNYNIPLISILEGPLDKGLLENSLRKIIDRQGSLRTSFEVINGALIQRIWDNAPLKFFYREESSLESAHEIIMNFMQPFDLSQVPLLRVILIKVEDAKHIFMLDIHHIVSDGASVGIILRELLALYAGNQLPFLKFQYIDQSEYQNRLKQSDQMERLEEYWVKKFESDSQLFRVPTDYIRTAEQGFDAEVIKFEISMVLFKCIKNILIETESTLYMLLFATYNVLLAIYTGQDDIIVGSPAANRSIPGMENVIGMFANMLALRSFPRGEKTFRQFLMEVKENALNAYENQDYQFDQLVKALGLQGIFNRNPLIDTVFTLQNPDLQGIYRGGREVSRFKIKPYLNYNKSMMKFDLCLDAIEEDNTVSMYFTYAAALFKRTTIEKMQRYYIEILEQIMENIDITLKDIKISHNITAANSNLLREDEGNFEF